MSKFATLFVEQEPFYSEPGNRYQPEYQLVINEAGQEELEVCGETDLQEKIQSHLEEVRIDNVIARYAAGDTQILEQVKGFCADISGMNMDFREVLNASLRGQAIFEQLPPEVRDLYHGNYVEFLVDPTKAMPKRKKQEVKETKEEKQVNDEQE